MQVKYSTNKKHINRKKCCNNKRKKYIFQLCQVNDKLESGEKWKSYLEVKFSFWAVTIFTFAYVCSWNGELQKSRLVIDIRQTEGH